MCLYVYLKVGDFRLMRWWTLCVQEGFHSAVKCWFVISGLDRFVMRKQLLLSRTESLFTKKSIPLIGSTHLWFTPICIYPNRCIKSMQLITCSCCLFLAQPHTPTNRTLFPFANCNEQSQMSTAFSPPSVPPGKPTLHTLHTIFMLCLRLRIHRLVI